MVFQKPNPFPAMSIARERAGRASAHRVRRRRTATSWSRSACARAGLWNEVKDRLSEGGMSLSGGQQQRLCIARALAVQPAGAADGRALLGSRPDLDAGRRGDDRELADDITIVIVTHNMQQAQRVSDDVPSS